MSRVSRLVFRLPRLRAILSPAWRLAALGACLATAATGAAQAKRSYHLPAGDAVATLRQLSEISGREILFAAEAVRGVRTNAIRGEFTPLEAARHMLAGTKLAATQDEKTGALAVHAQKPAASPRRGRRQRRPPVTPAAVRGHRGHGAMP